MCGNNFLCMLDPFLRLSCRPWTISPLPCWLRPHQLLLTDSVSTPTCIMLIMSCCVHSELSSGDKETVVASFFNCERHYVVCVQLCSNQLRVRSTIHVSGEKLLMWRWHDRWCCYNFTILGVWVITIHPLGNLNNCSKCHCSPFYRD